MGGTRLTRSGDWLAAAALAGAGLALAACGPPRLPAAAGLFDLTDGAEPGGAACVVAGPGDGDGCGPGLDVFSEREGGRLVARVERPAEVAIAWSELPFAAAGGRARVVVSGPVGLEGWASLEGRTFQLARDLALAEGHLGAAAGTGVAIAGTAGGGLVLHVPTPFAEPRSLEVRVPCDAVAYGRPVEGTPHEGPAAELVGASAEVLELRAAPGGDPLLAFAPWPGQALDLVESRGTWLRVRAGREPAQVPVAESTLLVDGWVPARSVRRRAEPEPDRSEAHCIPDRDDICPSALRRVALRAGVGVGPTPPGARVGTATPEAELLVVERREGFAAVELVDDTLAAPPGERFWLRATALAEECDDSSLEEEDGCPPCPERPAAEPAEPASEPADLPADPPAPAASLAALCPRCRLFREASVPRASRAAFRAVRVMVVAEPTVLGPALRNQRYSLAVQTDRGWLLEELGFDGVLSAVDHAATVRFRVLGLRVEGTRILVRVADDRGEGELACGLSEDGRLGCENAH